MDNSRILLMIICGLAGLGTVTFLLITWIAVTLRLDNKKIENVVRGLDR